MSKNKSNKTYKISMMVLLIAIIMSIAIPLRNNKNEVSPIEITKQNNGLPKLESFENLYNIMQENHKRYIDNSNYILEEENINDIQESTKTNIEEKIDYSKTNNQIEGIDEADIVKTDGKYIYYISNKKVVIVQVEKKLKIVSKIDYSNEEFNPTEIYVVNNRLVVIGNTNKLFDDVIKIVETYQSQPANTIAKVYNIENKGRVKLQREVEIEGNYISSRMIDENLYLVANKGIYYDQLKENIEEMNENDFKPKYIDTAVSEEENIIEFADISYFPESEDISYLTTVSFNVNENEKANIETYLGAGEEIYCSLNNIYVAKVKYEFKDEKLYGYYNNLNINTYIYKFKIEDSKIIYENVGSVPGKILNQFSMDEKDGYLRVATTNNNSFNNETNVNNLYVLNENLEIEGKVENLAKGERIYSIRFIENRAYMVTFVETDPLFVIDLSDNKNPILLGELKIPGYSRYLHPYDETHLIGFGENTETDENDRVVTDGVKMALFDVSNPSTPQELFTEKIGDKGTSSDILYNHKSLLFSKEKNILAFPIYITEETEDKKINFKFQGAIVYGLDLEKGFTKKGEITHQKSDDEFDYTKSIERIIYIDENIYTMSQGLIKSINMETMEEQGSVEIK